MDNFRREIILTLLWRILMHVLDFMDGWREAQLNIEEGVFMVKLTLEKDEQYAVIEDIVRSIVMIMKMMNIEVTEVTINKVLIKIAWKFKEG